MAIGHVTLLINWFIFTSTDNSLKTIESLHNFRVNSPKKEKLSKFLSL